MKFTAAALAAITASALAGEKLVITPQTLPSVRPFVLVESAYDFNADYDRSGSGSAWESRVRAGIIIPWLNSPLPNESTGVWRFRLGVDYHRFEFDHDSPLPLPDRLQSISAIIGLELNYENQIAALLEVRPGVYFEDDISSDMWDCPVRLGIGYRVNDHFSLALMGRYSGFAKYPVLGGIGFVWKINDRWTLEALAPEPRLIWKTSDTWAFWLGGEWAGGAYRVDRDESRGRFRGAVVDYTDYRVSLGTTWKRGGWQIEAAVGASLEREWDYHRADERFHTNEVSPFVKLSARTEW